MACRNKSNQVPLILAVCGIMAALLAAPLWANEEGENDNWEHRLEGRPTPPTRTPAPPDRGHTGQDQVPPPSTPIPFQEPCPADVTLDQMVDVLDLIEIVLHWGPCASETRCRADCNEDGEVDVMDLIQVITNWGLCP